MKSLKNKTKETTAVAMLILMIIGGIAFLYGLNLSYATLSTSPMVFIGAVLLVVPYSIIMLIH